MEIRSTHFGRSTTVSTNSAMLTCAYIFCWRTSSIDVRIFRDVRIFLAYGFQRWTRLGDVILMYVIRRRTCSTDVRLPPTYVIAWRTWSGDVRISRLHISTMHVRVFRRMCSINVRVLSTYVPYRRTCFHDVYVFGTTRLEIRDYAVEIEDSGLRRTLWIWLKKIAVDISGLSIAT